MTLTLEAPVSTEARARAFLAALTPVAPEMRSWQPDEDPTRDRATAIALVALVLTIPGAILDTMEVKDSLDRREIQQTLEALKTELAETDGSARLTLPSGKSLDLARTPTDAAIDLVVKELGRPR